MSNFSSTVILIVLSVTPFCHLSYSVMHSRIKRNAFQLSSLIEKYTNYNALKLSLYGNWCGRGGDRMKDGSYIDRCDLCCKKHDNCYRKSRLRPPFCTYSIYRTYKYHQSEKGELVCTEEEGTCHHALCQCDLKLVKCLSKDPCKLNDQNSGSSVSLLFRWAPFLESFG